MYTTRRRPRRPGERIPPPRAPKPITEPDKRYCSACMARVSSNPELAEHYRRYH